MGYQPIENYGVIGDLHTVALVGMDGSIDYMCFPNFDSPSIFLRLLDHDKGGYFSLAPVLQDAHQKQLYIPDTNVLLSRFLSEQGVAEISDFMPVEATTQAHNLIRRAKTVRGEIKYRVVCKPAFDYARAGHTIDIRDGEVIFSSKGQDGTVLRLRSSVPLHEQDGAAVGEFTLRTGETASFVLENTKGTVGDSVCPGLCRQSLQGHGQLLARVDWQIQIPGPLARNGQPLSADAKTADFLAPRTDSGRTHLWAA